MPDDLVLTPANEEVPVLSRLFAALARAQELRVQVEDGLVVLPPAAHEGLIRLLSYLSHGRSVAIKPVADVLTTQEAADFLGVSRPHLVALLDRGEIPFQRTEGEGTHRRISLTDLLAYMERISRPARVEMAGAARPWEVASGGLAEH